jgi:putative ABC transport system substrate-binding protein
MQFDQLKRRELIALLGGTAAWPLAARAQQPAMPVVGLLHLTSFEQTREYLAAFHQGLADTGYIERRNVVIEYRWGEGQNDRLPTLVADLVRRQVSVIVTLETTHGALAAKAATQTIPVLFMQGADPVRVGLVDSLSRPGGNVTAINLFLAEVAGKRLQMLLETVPSAKSIVYLRNPTNPFFAKSETREVQAAARALRVELQFANVARLSEIDTAFANFSQQRADAIFVSADGFLLTNSAHVVALAARYKMPAIYGWRQPCHWAA